MPTASFYLDPELIGGADVVRGPVANIYGSGAIGGVVSFRTKDVDDVLRPGETWGVLTRGEIGSNMSAGPRLGVRWRFAPIRTVEFMFGGVVPVASPTTRTATATIIPNTAYDDWSGIAKATFRPADGHEVKFGVHRLRDRATTPARPPPRLDLRDRRDKRDRRRRAGPIPGQTIAGSISTATSTGHDRRPIRSRPTAPTARSRASSATRATSRSTPIGFDAHNTSRFDTGPVRNALTYGGDAFRDQVNTTGFGTGVHAVRRTHRVGRVRAAQVELFDLARSHRRRPLRPL